MLGLGKNTKAGLPTLLGELRDKSKDAKSQKEKLRYLVETWRQALSQDYNREMVNEIVSKGEYILGLPEGWFSWLTCEAFRLDTTPEDLLEQLVFVDGEPKIAPKPTLKKLEAQRGETISLKLKEPEKLSAEAALMIEQISSSPVNMVSLGNRNYALVFHAPEPAKDFVGLENIQINIATNNRGLFTATAADFFDPGLNGDAPSKLDRTLYNFWKRATGIEFDKNKLEQLRLACSKLMNSKEKTDTSTTEKFTAAADPNNIGAALKAARKAAGFSQKQVAELLNADPSNIAKLEKGRTNPTISTVQKYAEVIGMDLTLSLKAHG